MLPDQSYRNNPVILGSLVKTWHSFVSDNGYWHRKKSAQKDQSLTLNTGMNLPYYMKFSRHVYFAILRCANLETLKLHDLAKNLYFEALQSTLLY